MFLSTGVKLHMGVNTKMDPDLRQEDERVWFSVELALKLGN